MQRKLRFLLLAAVVTTLALLPQAAAYAGPIPCPAGGC